MNRATWTRRCGIFILLALYATWMFSCGLLLVEQLSRLVQEENSARLAGFIGISAGLCILLNALLMAQLSHLAKRGNSAARQGKARGSF